MVPMRRSEEEWKKVLTPEQRAQYEKDGFFVVKKLLTA
jgi:hypothetical protein